MSPSGGSIFTTSAPMSAMICVQYGPITTAVRSTTRMPCSGPFGSLMLGSLRRDPEAVPDVVVVPIGDGREHQRSRVVADGVDMFADLFDRPRRPVHARGLRDEGAGESAGQRDEHF